MRTTTRRMLRWFGVTAAALVAVYSGVVAALFAVMHQPPDRVGAVMSRMPAPLFMVLPVRLMWTTARAGNSKVGDPAPDFSLRAADRKGLVRLSSFRGERPVVLVFGSYT